MMQELSMYSGNLTDVPFGHQLAATAGVDPRDYVRIFSRIHTSSSSNVPSVWIFLLVIFGILVFMLAMTSAVMHLLQIHRRNALRRRIENGEVNLESMGIKRLTVPSAIVNQMSCFTYNHGTQNLKKLPVDNEKPRSVIQSLEAGQTPRNDERTSEVDVAVLSIDVEKACSATIPQELRSYAQTECPICLDNFEVGVTPVRQLPCGHIFHPECIDYFLGHHSSLCPMCKKSVLPLGYCPTDITNNMVRRERNMRRLRSRVTVHSSTDNETAHRMKRFQDWSIGVGKQIFQSTFSVANYRPRSPASLHAREVQSHTPPQVTLSSTEIPMPLTPGLSRQEIAQRRGRALIARSVSLEDVDTARNQRRPKWRRRLARAFPGFS
ncbi:hypothetical protein PVAG01_04329 [Phlyctema vagabunda]|uniref:RING-type domain-containing protein n=1 Tax=Phlyctema vagabunda TaxID=108571 RepID=A0ABR4PPB4_9HELO